MKNFRGWSILQALHSQPFRFFPAISGREARRKSGGNAGGAVGHVEIFTLQNPTHRSEINLVVFLLQSLEGSLKGSPAAMLEEALLANLSSMYELSSASAGTEAKRQLGAWAANIAPDDFDAACVR